VSGSRPGEPPSGAPDYRGATNIPAYLRLAIPVAVLFLLVYFGMNWLTAQRPQHYHLYLQWELSIPFVPAMIYAYASIVPLYLLPAITLSKREMRALAGALVFISVVAAVCYLLLPAELGFERAGQVPGYTPVFQALYTLALPHNLVPSLHISSSTLAIAVLAHSLSSRLLQLGLLLWGVLIAVSVVLVHQHHLLDVISGLLLGLTAYRMMYLRSLAGDAA